MEKICKYCGKKFITKWGKQVYCNGKHYATCVICGKQFIINNKYINDIRNTCSRKCNAELHKRTNQERYGGPAPASSAEVQAKMKATNLERYGVESAMQSEMIQEKVKSQNLEKYGVEWSIQSLEIRKKIEETNIEKYGSISPMQNEEVKAKSKQTNLERYGVENVFCAGPKRDSIKQTYFDKTGYYEPFANPEVQAKSEATWQEKYGTKRPLQSEEVKQHMVETFQRNWGYDNPFQSPEMQERIRKSNLEKYGVENIAQSEEFKSKIRKTMIERYGRPYYSQTREWKLSRMKYPEKLDNLLEFRNDPVSYIKSHFDNKPSYKELWIDIGTSEGLRDTLQKFDCEDMVEYVSSNMEREVMKALLSIDPTLKEHKTLIPNTHRVITPMEIDWYLPEYKLGIECNPTETHNSSINLFGFKTDPEYTPYNYHQKKTDACDAKGIFMFHIFGPDWTHRRDIIISMLRNIMGKNENKIYARKTEIKGIPSEESSKFFNENHRQGNTHASVRIGLYYENELVSAMTFSKMRSTIGTSHNEDTNQIWELVRFCNKLNTSVVGGASKLFKYFLDKYNPKEIRSFSDRAHTRGNLYQTLGFHELRRSSAGYVWVEYKTDVPYHRVNAQKQHIRKFLNDTTIDIENLTEKEIMEDHGFVQLFDSGTITWQWLR